MKHRDEDEEEEEDDDDDDDDDRQPLLVHGKEEEEKEEEEGGNQNHHHDDDNYNEGNGKISSTSRRLYYYDDQGKGFHHHSRGTAASHKKDKKMSANNITSNSMAAKSNKNLPKIHHQQSTSSSSAELLPSDVSQVIGLGRWQIQIFMYIFVGAFFSTMENVSLPFVAFQTDYWCNSGNTSHHQLHHHHAGQSLNHSQSSSSASFDEKCYTNNGTKECTSWSYDTSYKSIISEWNLVCDKSWIISFSQTMFMLGMLFASICSGYLADRLGRKFVILIGFVIEIAFGFYCAFAPNVYHFLISKFGIAFGQTSRYITGTILVMEICPPHHRSDFANAIQFGGVIGYLCLPGIAYLVKDFRQIQLITSAPELLFLIGWIFLPESPRWLLTKGRIDEAKVVIKSAVACNTGLPVNSIEVDDQIDHLVSMKFRKEEKSFNCHGGGGEDKDDESLMSLWRSPVLRKRTIALYVSWFVNEFVYYGFSLSAGNLGGGDTYVNAILLGVVEFPAYLMSMFLLKRYTSRRIPFTSIMILGAVVSLSTIAVIDVNGGGNSNSMNSTVQIILSSIGKFAVTTALGMLYVYSGEIFPTILRNIGLGSCCMMGRIGSTMSSFVDDLGKGSHPFVPTTIFGSLCLMNAIVVSLFLPKSMNSDLPDTMKDVENDDDSNSRRKLKISQ